MTKGEYRPEQKVDDPLDEYTGLLMDIGNDENEKLIAVVRIDGNIPDDAHDMYYSVNCIEALPSPIEPGDRIRLSLGKSATTDDGLYCEIERENKNA